MSMDPKGVTRREVLMAGIAGAAAVGSGSEQPGMSRSRMPVAFIPHGGGPWPFVDLGFDRGEQDALAAYLTSVARLPRSAPKALLVISAHWEAPVPTVMTAPRPPMLYDYYGFPEASYEITWPAPGHPELAARVRELLQGHGFSSAADGRRGFDHGTFVPLKLMYPDAAVPTVQLSLKEGLDPGEHLAMGRALAPLRDEGVFMIGSGMTYHNLRGFGRPEAAAAGRAFDAWLQESMGLPPAERERRLRDWERAPAARAVHPREEHLLPLMVIAGVAGADPATVAFSGEFMGVPLS
ncbi:MAG TPA: class III extradiol ring-cleavage dioxygenase, partial [Myxococcota bacterium]|nr:class III extradiol ring-cleavage dioxygenase [Myxococcota bacterium]